jgi:hypothetical protein
MEKQPLGNFFNLNALERKGTFVGEKTNGSFNQIPFKRRGTTFQSEGD